MSDKHQQQDPEKAALLDEKLFGQGEGLAVPLVDSSGVILGRSSVNNTVFNLMNTYIGAAMMSLPHIFASLGVVIGFVLTLLVAAICNIGEIIVAKASDRSGWRTYTEVSRHDLGRGGGYLCQAAVIFNNLGILVVYLVMFGDILIGKEDSGLNGVLPSLVGDHSGEAWYLSRWFVELVIILVVLQPLILQKHLHNLVGSSTFAISLAYSFGIFLAVLAILGAVRHKNEGAPIWVNLNLRETSESPNCVVNVLLKGLSTIVFAYIAFYNVPPLMVELKDYTLKRMTTAIWLSVAFTCLLYAGVGVTGAMIFGNNTDGDILVNLNKVSLSMFMSSSLATVIGYMVAIGYALKLMFIYPMENWGVRENISTLFGGSPRPVGWPFYVITYGTTLVAYIISLYVKSVYDIAEFVGATACSVIGLILPAMLARKAGYTGWLGKLLVAFFWIVGIVLVFHGTFGKAWEMIAGKPLYCY